MRRFTPTHPRCAKTHLFPVDPVLGPTSRNSRARSLAFARGLVGEADIAGVSQQKIRLAPLPGILEVPLAVVSGSFEPHAPDPAPHQIHHAGSRVFYWLGMSLADPFRELCVETGDRAPFAG